MTAKEINKILRRYIPSGTVLGTTREKLIYELQDLHQREVNKLNLPDVIQRSEQLNAFLSKLVEEFDNGEVSWNTRDDAENMIKSF